MPGTLPLRLPPVDIDQRVLDIVPVSPKALIRVSRYNTGEPFFGRTGACRFDDAARQFGTCYLGFDLTVAFAESVLHNKEPDSSGFAVPGSEIDACFALSFSGKDLKLAKLYGAALLRLGGNGEISGTGDYTVPQAWASALVAHPANIDGFIDMSRRVNDAFAVVLFERDAMQPAYMRLDQNVALFDHVDYLVAKAALAVTLN
jgi:hypothetical protein